MAATILSDPTSASAISRFLIPDLPASADVIPFLCRIDEARWYSNFGPLVCEL